MPTVGVYLSNSTYAKLYAKYENGIGRHLSQMADAEVGVNAKVINKKTGEITKTTKYDTMDEEVAKMVGGL